MLSLSHASSRTSIRRLTSPTSGTVRRFHRCIRKVSIWTRPTDLCRSDGFTSTFSTETWMKHILSLLVLLGVHTQVAAETPSEIRHNGLKPIVLCNASGDCSGKDYVTIRMEGNNPVVRCESQSECAGASYVEVRQNGLDPVVFCNSAGDCNGVAYTKIREQGMEPVVTCTASG